MQINSIQGNNWGQCSSIKYNQPSFASAKTAKIALTTMTETMNDPAAKQIFNSKDMNAVKTKLLEIRDAIFNKIVKADNLDESSYKYFDSGDTIVTLDKEGYLLDMLSINCETPNNYNVTFIDTRKKQSSITLSSDGNGMTISTPIKNKKKADQASPEKI